MGVVVSLKGLHCPRQEVGLKCQICILILSFILCREFRLSLATNGLGLCEGGDFQQKISTEALSYKYSENLQRSIFAPLLQNPCYLLAVFLGLDIMLSTSFFR